MSQQNGGSRERGGVVGIERETVTARAHLAYLPLAEKLEVRRMDFPRMVGEYARSHRKHCRTARERARCDDIIRGQSLSHAGLELLCELAARSEEPFALEELIRGAVLQRLAAPQLPCVFEASYAEQLSNESLNTAQLLAHQDKTDTRWAQVWETGQQQLYATRRLIDAAAIRARLA